MEPLIDFRDLRKILERGLETGKWSVSQFNRGHLPHPILPSSEFLESHPQFIDMNHRDLSAYKRANHRSVI